MVWRVHVCTIKILKWTRILIGKKNLKYLLPNLICLYVQYMYYWNFKWIRNKIINQRPLFFFFPFPAYGYGTLANLLCCLCSLAGAFIIPFAKRHKTAYNVVLSVFMGLAVGALASDAILHLVPEVSSGPPSFVLLSF